MKQTHRMLFLFCVLMAPNCIGHTASLSMCLTPPSHTTSHIERSHRRMQPSILRFWNSWWSLLRGSYLHSSLTKSYFLVDDQDNNQDKPSKGTQSREEQKTMNSRHRTIKRKDTTRIAKKLTRHTTRFINRFVELTELPQEPPQEPPQAHIELPDIFDQSFCKLCHGDKDCHPSMPCNRFRCVPPGLESTICSERATQRRCRFCISNQQCLSGRCFAGRCAYDENDRDRCGQLAQCAWCNNDWECEHGYCIRGRCALTKQGAKKCRKRGKRGLCAKCNDSKNCQDGWCLFGQCAPSLSVREKCKSFKSHMCGRCGTEAQCEYTKCIQGICARSKLMREWCVQRWKGGTCDHCQRDYHCNTGLCIENMCAPSQKIRKKCRRRNECATCSRGWECQGNLCQNFKCVRAWRTDYCFERPLRKRGRKGKRRANRGGRAKRAEKRAKV